MTGWFDFTEREPTPEELATDRVLGHFLVHDQCTRLAVGFYAKIFWVEDAKRWAVEGCSPTDRGMMSSQINYQFVKPTHWCLLDELPPRRSQEKK